MAIKIRSIIEIIGAPKDHVDHAMGTVISKIKENKSITIHAEKVFEAKPIEGQPLFNTFCEVDLELKNVSDVLGFCFDFMPSSIEVYEPMQISLKAENFNDMCNEMTSKLHQYDMAMRNVYAQNILLKRKYEGDTAQSNDPQKKE